MDIEQKLELITRAPTEEVVVLEELRQLLETNDRPAHYIGLEISGLLHLGSLIISAFKMQDFMEAGLSCTVFLADWHSYINNKFKGNWELIKNAARYYDEAFKFVCPGVKTVLGSELYENNDEYWVNLIQFSKRITLARNIRCLTIMGRSEKDKLDFAQYLYPPMQAVDIKTLDLDLVHSGLDQRKIHMLVREVFPKMEWKTPVAIHHHLIPGLSKPITPEPSSLPNSAEEFPTKMSKSKPATAIFVHDEQTVIEAKIAKAWCPEGVIKNNPILDIVKNIVMHEAKTFEIERPSKFGGSISFTSYEEVQRAFTEKKLHPADLKRAVAREINRVVTPIRGYLATKKDLLKAYLDETSS